MARTKDNIASKKKVGPYQAFFKRFFDVLLSFLLMIILSPILLLIYIINLITLGGNPIFGQFRPGKNGRVFKLYKFRSMTNKTDENGDLLPDEKRITKFGKLLRKTGLDELPQLINIFRGDMSFVGPRPRLIKDMIFYDKDVIEVYSVRPGITSLSQIAGGRSEASWESIFEKDKEYVEHISFWGDIKIIFKTFFALFKKENKSGNSGESKRDYYYPDYLLKTKKITQEQYIKGISMANEMSNKKSIVKFEPKLHKSDERNKNNE